MAEKPEMKTRAGIDQLLAKAGWTVQSTAEANHGAGGTGDRQRHAREPRHLLAQGRQPPAARCDRAGDRR